ncbi:hypothetical protein Hte_010909 [Hypoxylon texense]
MAPAQNTFSIIPNAPCAINTDLDSSQPRLAARPMTTKQAKKAYQKKNKGPKLSKAEQRRQDLFEQDRIRKEFEKERNQARARAARDKKKEREEKERAERKKKGLPLVDVHPSQDTIAWFVRGDRRKQETRTASPATADADDSDNGTQSAEDEPEPPPKRQRTEFSIPDGPEGPESAKPGSCPSSAGMLGISPTAARVPNIEATTDNNSPAKEQPASEHPNLDLDDPETVDELLDELVTIPSSLPYDSEAARDGKPLPEEQDNHVPNRLSPPKLPDGRSHSPIPTQNSPQEQKAEDSASLPSIPQPLQTLVTDKINLRDKQPTPNRTKPSVLESPIKDLPVPTSGRNQPHVSAPPSFRHPKTPMGPPRLPPKFKAPSHTPASGPRTPQFLVKQPHVPKFKPPVSPISRPHGGYMPQRTAGEQPPMSTQLFMFSHLDDFFPSPSQEVREVFGESKPSIRKNDVQPKPKPAHPTRLPLDRSPLSDSTPSMLNINRAVPKFTESKTGPRFAREIVSTNQSRNLTSLLTAKAQPSNKSEAFHVPFFSTQDFFLSSQDIKDLEDETPSWLGIKPREDPAPSKHAPKTVDPPPLPEATRSKSGISPITSVSQSATKRIEKSELNSGTKSIDTHDWPPHIQVSETSNEGCKGSTVRATTITTTNEQGRRIRPSSGNIKNDAGPNSDNKGATNQGRKPQVSGPSQTRNRTIQPRASPKPFFGSSCREAQYKYIIERNKTTKWEDAAARQKVQEQLERLRRSEDERLNSLLHGAAEDGSSKSVANCASSPKTLRGPTSQRHSQPKGRPQPLTVNQLSKPSQKNTEPNEGRQKRSRSRSSYEIMLEELEQLSRKENKGNQKQEKQAPAVPASQETDYGDAGLDDVLYEML